MKAEGESVVEKEVLRLLTDVRGRHCVRSMCFSNREEGSRRVTFRSKQSGPALLDSRHEEKAQFVHVESTA